MSVFLREHYSSEHETGYGTTTMEHRGHRIGLEWIKRIVSWACAIVIANVLKEKGCTC